jgi:membrane-associated phospholipid phosphatase
MRFLRAADLAGLRLARTVGHSPRAERAVRRLTLLGEHGAIWIAVGLAGASVDRRRREEWLRAAAVVAAAYGANQVVKLIVRRRRPELAGLPPLVHTRTDLSFPSAHATTSFAGLRAYRDLGLPVPALALLATGLALSRPYLGVHYPSDTLAGAALGAAIAAAA